MPETLQPGDIVIFHTMHKKPNGVAVGQGLAQGLKLGLLLPTAYSSSSDAFHGKSFGSTFTSITSVNAVHAAIVVAKRKYGSDYDIAHVTQGGPIKGYLKENIRLYGGKAAIYRLTNKEELTSAAAKVSATWAPEQCNAKEDQRFASGKAFGSAFHSSGYGSQAQIRAAFYAKNKATRGGPQDAKNLAQGTHKSFFCSMFAIACYQAAIDEGNRKRYIALDAKHTSPMVLEDYLSGHQDWKRINHGL